MANEFFNKAIDGMNAVEQAIYNFENDATNLEPITYAEAKAKFFAVPETKKLAVAYTEAEFNRIKAKSIREYNEILDRMFGKIVTEKKTQDEQFAAFLKGIAA